MKLKCRRWIFVPYLQMALDNALEELERSSAAKMDRKEDGEQQNGWIRLKISCQGKMACFVFENPVCPQKKDHAARMH